MAIPMNRINLHISIVVIFELKYEPCLFSLIKEENQ